MTEASQGVGPVLQPATADLPMDPAQFEGTSLGQDIPGFQPETEPNEDEQAIADLSETAKQDFIGLMHLGYLEEECTVAGHRFLLKTPWHDERIERGVLHKPYIASMNFEPMWELITVAAYCCEIDGVAAPEPLGPKGSEVATRLDWIKRSIFSSIVIRMLHTQCALLDARERAVVEYVEAQSKS